MSILGLIGNDDWVTDERPKNWREAILRLYPNGDAPLTALLAKLKSSPTNDPEYNWWEKEIDGQTATITGVYKNVGLSTAYTTGGVEGDTLYVKMSLADVGSFRDGHVVMFRDNGQAANTCVGLVNGVTQNGANSFLSIQLLEDDDNGTAKDISDADDIQIIGNANAEGAEMPDAISYRPRKVRNYTEIFRTPLSIARTARKTKLRTGDQYKELKREALEIHSVEMERAFIWNIPKETTGSNGKPMRTTCGLIPAIRGMDLEGGTAGTVATFSGTWSTGGLSWLNTQLELIFRYGSDERLCFIGSQALLGLNELAMATGQYQLVGGASVFGIKVMEWITPFGVIYLKRHPLFSYSAMDRTSMVLFEPSQIVERPLDDTAFYADKNEKTRSGRRRIDGTDEEYLTETGLEFHFPKAWGWLTNVGDALNL